MLIADDPGDNAHNGICHHRRRQFTARQHIVADADLTGDEMFADAMVDTFVVSAKNDDVVEQRQFVGNMLIELLSVGRGEDDLVVVAFSLQRRDTAVDGLTLHHHPRKAAVGIIVHPTPLVQCVVAKVMQPDLCQSFLFGTCQNALMHEPLNHLWQYGDNVYSHFFFLFCYKIIEFFWGTDDFSEKNDEEFIPP